MTAPVVRCFGCGHERPGAADLSGLCPFCLLQLGLDGADEPQSPWLDPVAWTCRILNVLDVEGGETSYLAEQAAPARRLVVLRQVNVPVGSAGERSRASARLQALVAFDHPNVAPVLGGLVSETGGLFLVTAYTPGTAVASYCARERLAPHDRFALLLPVVEALQRAHDRGLVHGHLTPSRVVVTMRGSTPAPIVTGFGPGLMREPASDSSVDVAAILEVMRCLDLEAPAGEVRTMHELASRVRARL
ncbi:MAG: hypothetical protein IMZ67_02875 [Acidobacteria bacterium]|nr:hypothetical protein [Acidobacteriota bacterium]